MGARTVIAALLGLSLAPGMTSCTGAEESEGPMRVVVLGDSLTHGSSGDWTWRYFLHQQLLAGGADVEFVGGRTGVADDPPDEWGESKTPEDAIAYADSNFDSDHHSVWGDSVTLGTSTPSAVMAQHDPDVVVYALGWNDLTWLRVDPQQLLSEVQAQVVEFRAANPSVRIVIAQAMVDVAHWSQFPVAEYNRLLLQSAPSWSTAESPVAVATVPADLQAVGKGEERDTWDGAHPDTSGQVKIASQVADALAEVGVGSGHDPSLVVPTEGLRSSSTLKVKYPAGDPTSARLAWVGPPGATGHDVWMALDDGDYTQVARDVRTAGHKVTGLEPGHRHTFKVIARKHAVRSADDQFSTPVSVVARPG
ncbi:SGNH/GDSL hydrolase family protein [Nocardioides gilvus]|uniref:SGNH/GDSL hydrolase family protein n=1 Tax=Nocardioides gilvus TaxID=1735589 RepID=UPI000D74D3BD|nr:SGNH/GDSL hydrolase family protein [Nocardioides gilvus]